MTKKKSTKAELLAALILYGDYSVHDYLLQVSTYHMPVPAQPS